MKRFYYAMITTGKPARNGLRNWKTGEVSHFCIVKAFTTPTARNAWVKEQPRDTLMNADWQPALIGMIRREHRGMTLKHFRRFMRDVKASVND